jgi:hypothetical protein
MYFKSEQHPISSVIHCGEGGNIFIRAGRPVFHNQIEPLAKWLSG